MKVAWPHQGRALEQFHAVANKGVKRILITSPTGGGKSYIMEQIAEWAVSSCIYSNRKMLTDQLIRGFREAGFSFGVRAAGYDDLIDINAAIQIASIQTEHSRVVRQERWQHFAGHVVEIDEAHIQKGDMAIQMMERHLADSSIIVGLTATPLGIGHLYDELIVAGTKKELRQTGALLPCLMYAPDELDLSKIKKEKVGVDFSANNIKAVWTQAIYGRVITHHKRLNPEFKPALGMAPDVESAVWFAKEYEAAGIPAAAVDGDEIWFRGERMESTDENRLMVNQALVAGEIAIIWNRFVYREAVNIPELYHLILACPIGSTMSYHQTVGRVLRNHPSLDHVCVARDTEVLTDRGLVKIQDVTQEHLVWDGIEFVSHGGVVCRGTKSVIQHDGLIATPDHKVHTNDGWKEILEAKSRGQRITRTGLGRTPVRVSDDSDPHRQGSRPKSGSRGGLQQMRGERFSSIPQDFPQDAEGVWELHEEVWRSLPGMDLSPSAEAVAAMQRSEDHLLREIWRPWDSIQVHRHLRSHMLDCGEHWCPRGPQADNRPNQQQRPLRAWEPEVGYSIPADQESREAHPAKLQIPEIPVEISSCWVPQKSHRLPFPSGHDGGTDCREMGVAEVWDILDCGPRHRFTANGRLVANCIQDHGGNWHRHGSPNADVDWQAYWKLDETIIAKERREAFKDKTDEEPIRCGNCGLILVKGIGCLNCGHVPERSVRVVIQHDGQLVEKTGDVYPKRKVDKHPSCLKKWESMYHRMKKADKTFAQADGLYAYENWGKHVPKDAPLMPKDRIDFHRKIRDVPRNRLH